jgi:hypothetical protein
MLGSREPGGLAFGGIMRQLMLAITATVVLASSSFEAFAESGKVGVLDCDVSAGLGLIVMQKQTMRCKFTSNTGAREFYVGKIEEFGIALGEQAAGKLAWIVIAATSGMPNGALAGTYAGVGADASVGVGLGANVLVGGTGRAFSLQPLSVEGEVGLNIAAGVTTVTLVATR